MKIQKNTIDTIAYIGFCICSFGIVAILRVVISVAIRKAIKNQ